MDATQQANAAIELLTPLVEGTSAGQMAEPTPCAKWTVSDLMNHFVGGGHMFAAAFRGEALPEEEGPVDLLGADHVQAYRAAIDDFHVGVGSLGSMEQPVALPIGTVPAEIALRIAAGDLLVHGWDLSQATGQAFDPPAAFVEEVDAFYRMAISDDLRDGDTFGAAVEVGADAPPLDKLVAFAGRRP